MSMDVGGTKGGPKSDINVTPLVDVMLVLLIIMMLVAPLLQQGVSLRLPTAANTTDKPEVSEQTVVAVAANKAFYLNSLPVTEGELGTKVMAIFEKRSGGDRVVLIKADVEAEYGAVMVAMDQLRQAGIEDIALITEKKKGSE